MEARIVGANIVGVLVAGAMLELHIRELLRYFDRLIHVAVGRREDELGPVLSEVLQDWHGARIFLHILHIARDDLALERRLHRQTAFVMRPGPAVVADWPEEDEADFHGFGRESAVA
jgi:hypothetical protein